MNPGAQGKMLEIQYLTWPNLYPKEHLKQNFINRNTPDNLNDLTYSEIDGRGNLFAKEPQMYIDPQIKQQMDNNEFETHNERAERLNGRLAMLGVIAAIGAYAVTGQLIPGVF